jgi:hypothetical protein
MSAVTILMILQKYLTRQHEAKEKTRWRPWCERWLPGVCSRYLVVQEDSKIVRHSSGPSPLHSCKNKYLPKRGQYCPKNGGCKKFILWN